MKLRNKKTGEIFDALIREKEGGGSYSLIVCDIKAYETSKSTLDETHFILDEYETLAELNEEWEDYVPKEPLIKDEKIRAIFKMWADNFKNAMIDGIFTFYVDREYHSFMVNLKPTGESRLDDVAEIDLNFDCDGLEDGKSYTIAELCGEEEE